jgi:hypothetical protein
MVEMNVIHVLLLLRQRSAGAAKIIKFVPGMRKPGKNLPNNTVSERNIKSINFVNHFNGTLLIIL